MITALIIDDQQKCRTSLALDLKTYCQHINIVGEADGVQSGIVLINQLKPEVVFLDIQLKDGTGFDVLEQIKSQNNTLFFSVVFTTAYNQYAITAFKFSALDYLLKPIVSEELIAAVEKIKHRHLQSNLLENLSVLFENKTKNEIPFKKIVLNTADSMEIHRVDDIIRCEANVDYTCFYFKDKTKLLVSRSLKEFDNMLSSQGFIRIHQSHLININYIIKYKKSDGGYAIMADGFEAPVSRNKKEEFMRLLASL